MKQDSRDVETEIVHIDLSGTHFDIPIHYLYGKTIEKYRQWPKAVNSRVTVDALTLSVLLPDMRPYHVDEDLLWKSRGHGDRVEVTIMKFSGPPENWERGIDINRAAADDSGFYSVGDSIYGLTRYIGTGQLQDKLFAEDRQLQITCDRTNPLNSETASFISPSCLVKSKYVRNIDLEYYYGLDHLPNWREIDDRLKATFDRFAEVAQSRSSK